MGERKSKLSCKKTTPSRSYMASTVAQQGVFVSSNAKIVRCPDGILNRLRRLHEAEIITLFTPFVPHPPATKLAKDSDPFEPLGRALPRQVRHVPYRLDKGMTELHADFLPASGAVVIVVCVTENVLRTNAKAFEQQVDFGRNIWRRIHEISAIAGIPTILLLVSSDAAGQAYADAMQEFPALVMANNYTTSGLADAVRVLFGL